MKDFAGDLDELKRNIAKFKKGKFGKGLSDIDIDDLDFIDANSRKVKAVTIFIYETSVWSHFVQQSSTQNKCPISRVHFTVELTRIKKHLEPLEQEVKQ